MWLGTGSADRGSRRSRRPATAARGCRRWPGTLTGCWSGSTSTPPGGRCWTTGRPLGPGRARWRPTEHPRWVFPDGSRTYRQLLDAGISVGRCHDIALTERILLARAGRYGEPSGAGSRPRPAARRAGPAGPDIRREPSVEGGRDRAPSLFDDASPAPAVRRPGRWSGPLRTSGADRRRRCAAAAGRGRVGQSALAAAEMVAPRPAVAGEVHESLLAEAARATTATGRPAERLAELADRSTRRSATR